MDNEKYITYGEDLVIGKTYSWETFGGKKYTGQLIELDGDSAYLDCIDGERRAVHIDWRENK